MFNIFGRKKNVDNSLFFKTDLHCHLVPGIDDGQRTAESAVELVAAEKRWGIERILCTPHITQETFPNTPETIVPAFKALEAAVREAGIEGVELDYSAEHRLDEFFQEQLAKGVIRSLPGNFLLVENSFLLESMNLDQVLFDLRLRGYQPILAHPERYSYYFHKRERYHQLHESGTYFQVNLLSLAGYYGKEVKQVAEYLMKNDLIDFLGSDMHNASHCEAIEAYLSTKDYRRHRQVLEGRIMNDRI